MVPAVINSLTPAKEAQINLQILGNTETVSWIMASSTFADILPSFGDFPWWLTAFACLSLCLPSCVCVWVTRCFPSFFLPGTATLELVGVPCRPESVDRADTREAWSEDLDHLEPESGTVQPARPAEHSRRRFIDGPFGEPHWGPCC